MHPRSPDTTDKSVGTRVRMERLAAGITQQTLAESLGISFQQIQKYEKGVNRITIGRITQICEALQIPVERIIGNDGRASVGCDPKLEEIQTFLATRDGMALMTAFRSIPPGPVRKELISLVESIAVDLTERIAASQSKSTARRGKSKV